MASRRTKNFSTPAVPKGIRPSQRRALHVTRFFAQQERASNGAHSFKVRAKAVWSAPSAPPLSDNARRTAASTIDGSGNVSCYLRVNVLLLFTLPGGTAQCDKASCSTCYMHCWSERSSLSVLFARTVHLVAAFCSTCLSVPCATSYGCRQSGGKQSLLRVCKMRNISITA
jgi:hypothetical protein